MPPPSHALRARALVLSALAALAALAAASSELTGSRYHPVLDAHHRDLVGPYGLDASVDCAMRNLTYWFAMSVQPARAPMVDVFDALRLAVDCNQSRPSAAPLAALRATAPFEVPGRARRAAGAFAATYFVDAAAGVDDDQRSGSADQPFATPGFAVARARAGARPAQVLLTDTAPFYLASPLVLTSEDEGLSVAAAPTAATMPVVSAGAPLGALAWTSVGPAPGSGVNGTPVATVWSAPLPKGLSLPFDQLFAPTGRRATRARFPNGNPENEQQPNGWTKAASWRAAWAPPDDQVQLDPLHSPLSRKACAKAARPCEPARRRGGAEMGKEASDAWHIFCCFYWGWNASVSNFSTGSFWGTSGSPGGGTFHSPGGLVAGNETLPRMAAWTGVSEAVVHAFHALYWGSWQWTMKDADPSSGIVDFARGGFQEGRGYGAGDYLYFENLRSELDWAGEWFLDAPGATLYYVANGTAAPDAVGWVASQLDNIVSVLGDAGLPARGVELVGLAFMHTSTTFMQPFQVPSGGDMSYHDGGAVRLRGTEGCAVRDSLFKNLGGSGVMIKDYNLDALVAGNEFVFVGEHAICSMGRGDRQDQLDGDVPTRNAVVGNLAHEFALYGT